MVNCDGRCVEAEDPRRDRDVVRKETLRAMEQVFVDQLYSCQIILQCGDAITVRSYEKDASPSNLPSLKGDGNWASFLRITKD
ncbi:hypothetical protein Cni_G28800 [Canna indica]|uniref:Uncharacterized protein n=1 Tax=Canna indica TaxID=4628 RepID=A0AAQ3L3E2_9LILI|nr:hypothetical protein Cni_G28800 [Canna indica]